MADTDRVPRPVEAMEFLSRKANIDTDRWNDLKWGEHSHAFTVAHSVDANVCDKIHGLLNKAMADGEAFGTFKKGMLEMMANEGWYGGAGHSKDEKEYVNWRIRVIYDTNMKTAYAAGHYRQQTRHAEMRPIWEYVSKLVGKNRREDHLALHGKAFRFDDPIWNEIYPPNGWGCECSVITLSESGAEREGVEVLKSDADGNPPAMADRNGNAVDWNNFAPEEWKYNPGREALAPNFDKYQKLPKEMRDGLKAKYHQDMSNTSLSEGEFTAFMGRYSEKDYKPINVLLQVGNLESGRFAKMQKEGVLDSKIMAFDYDLHHGTADKYKDQAVPVNHYKTVYQAISKPDHIYFEKGSEKDKQGKAYHFVKSTGDGKVIKVFLRHKSKLNALKITTIGWIPDDYENHPGRYKEIR
jgi:SPP1 gp7 family putative phage head morphogenesis protein